jgi:hypothetical protein
MTDAEKEILDCADKIKANTEKIWGEAKADGFTRGMEFYGDRIIDAFVDAGLVGFDLETGNIVSKGYDFSQKIVDVLKNTDKQIWEDVDKNDIRSKY